MRDIQSFSHFFKNNLNKLSIDELYLESIEMIVYETLHFTHLSPSEIKLIKAELALFI
jgi:hypothetical protein